jgi:hypothetical protein
MRDDESEMPQTLTQQGIMKHEASKMMTVDKAREWMNAHWDADEVGTDLDCDTLEEAFEAIFGRKPEADEDAFGTLKNHFQNH